MSQIDIRNLTFAYEGSSENIFENISVRLDTDWKLGLTGRNGRGKTTLLRLLRGDFAYRGTIDAHADFVYFPFEVADHSRPAREIMEKLCPAAQPWELEREISRLAVRLDTLSLPFSSLSGGEQTKLLLAALFLGDDRFPLIDEPTNHLDLQGRGIVSNYLRGKKGFILVSHDRAFLDGCIDHVMSINKTSVEVRQGSFSAWLEDKRRQDEFELAKKEKLKKEISRLSESSARAAEWSTKTEKSKHAPLKSGLSADRGYIGHKSAKMMRRAKNIEQRQQDAAEEKKSLLKDLETADVLKLTEQDVYHSRRLLTLERTTVLYGGKPSGRPISFTAERGDRIALCGPNGCGKSSILKLICGEPLAFAGTFEKASGLQISYIPQDNSGLCGSLYAYAAEHGVSETLLFSVLRKLDFSRQLFEMDMAEYSEGQKKKVVLARSMCEHSHLLVWDEPLNYIDVFSRIQVEELLLEYRPTILFVEHDRAFCEKAATKTVTFG